MSNPLDFCKFGRTAVLKYKLPFLYKMKIYCCCCSKQAVKGQNPLRHDKYITKLEGSRVSFNSNEVFCGYCAEELDENGLSPEERAELELD